MRRFIIPPLLVLALAAAVRADDEAQFAAGQRFLEKISKAWSEQLPPERIVGMYFGRKWGGVMRFQVKAATSGGGASYEFSGSGDMSMGQKMQMRAVLGPKLEPISGEITEVDRKGKKQSRLEVQNGHWKLNMVRGDETKTVEGDLKPGYTWEAKFLIFYAGPDDPELAMRELEEEKGVVVMKKSSERRQASIGGKLGLYECFDLQRENALPCVAFIGDDGCTNQVQFIGSPARFLVIEESAIGKDLVEEINVAPSAKAVIALYKAIKRGDQAEVLASFDLVRFTETMTDGFAGLDEAKKKEILDATRQKIEADMADPRFLGRLPGLDTLEDAFAINIRSKEKDGQAEVYDPLGQIWKLVQGTDGRWVIVGWRHR